MTHAIDIRVRGYHMDVFGHVNNARYLEFLEDARWAFFDGDYSIEQFAKIGFAFNVVNININYRKPASLNDLLTVETGLEKFGKRSVTLYQQVTDKDNGNTIADALVTFVLLDMQKHKAAILEGDLKEKLMVTLGT
jgi:thioesterase-3